MRFRRELRKDEELIKEVNINLGVRFKMYLQKVEPLALKGIKTNRQHEFL